MIYPYGIFIPNTKYHEMYKILPSRNVRSRALAFLFTSRKDESDDDENDVPGNNEFNNYVVWIYLFLPFT